MPNHRLSAEVEIQVPFHDCDPMGITWHGNYLRYFEVARCALLEKINFGYREMDKTSYIWPVVDARVKYVRPTTFEQVLIASATVVEYENRLKLEYRVRDKVTGDVVTKGFTIQVAVTKAKNELCFVSPDILLDRIGGARD